MQTLEETSLLRAILENPLDDTCRLVFADYLDEQDDAESKARASFIRDQIAFAKLGDGVKCLRNANEVTWDPRVASDSNTWFWGRNVFTPRCRCSSCSLCRRMLNASRKWMHGAIHGWETVVKQSLYTAWQARIDAEMALLTIPTPADALDMTRFVAAMTVLQPNVRVTFRRGFADEIAFRHSYWRDDGDGAKHLRELFQNNPITRVRLLDIEPLPPLVDGVMLSGWREPLIGSRDAIPSYRLWAKLVGEVREKRALYDSAGEAQTALSRACVNVGRELAGLPPLEDVP